MNHSLATTPSAPNRVPAVAWHFWLLKILCTTVGETAADFLNEQLGLGLAVTTLVMGGLLALALFLQFMSARYVASIYWFAAMSISVVGTLVTDILSDNLEVPLEISTLGFGVGLLLAFGAWYANEGTLSIRTIVTARREAFYWIAVFLTFALGTAVGDWLAEDLGLGYLHSGALFGGVILAVAIGYRWFRLGALSAFWIAYVLTRPLGASLGDYLAQAPARGGLGLGTSMTSALFVGAIAVAIVYLSVTKRDVMAST
jgi:uncharacterized membrane-anchored protein